MMSPLENIGKTTPSKIWRKDDEITEPDFINQLARPSRGGVHLIGIGGTGMNALARALVSQGIRVTGSDLQDSPLLVPLRKMGIKIHLGHKSEYLPQDCELVVRSAAIPPDNPEFVQAIKKGVRVIKYSKMLGILMREKYGIAVSGSHGKTTTTALVSYLLRTAGKDPSFIIGGDVPDLAGNAHIGKGEHFVAEACEYDRSFHNLFYKMAIITNIEADHLDYYRDLAEIIEAFSVFVRRAECIIANADDPNVLYASRPYKGRVIKFGLATGEWVAKNIKVTNNFWSFEVWHLGKKWAEITWRMPGRHNVYNALATVAAGNSLGLAQPVIVNALENFKGVARRFQILGKVNDALVIDDYGHHPSEIKAVLETARENFPGKHLWCVFQPHQASRTRIFLDRFAQVFKMADQVILPNIYFARDSEATKREISSSDLMRQINNLNGKAIYLGSFPEIVGYLRKHLTKNEIVITLGAGDVWKIAHQLTNNNGRIKKVI